MNQGVGRYRGLTSKTRVPRSKMVGKLFDSHEHTMPKARRSEELFARARAVLPGGVNTPIRSFRKVGGGAPRFITTAIGCYLMDVDGNRYVDMIGSYGAMILGHCNPRVTDEISSALRTGTSFGAASDGEVVLAEEIVKRIPSIEKIRFVNSGTEAVMSAIRLARAATGRRTIVKFEGCYHGHVDGLMSAAGSGLAGLALGDGCGEVELDQNEIVALDYNNVAAVTEFFRSFGRDVAAVIVEPVAGNMGVVPPTEGFLSQLRIVTHSFGSILIFDEVMTGLRIASSGAQQLYGVFPDLTVLGKALGGGLPIGAFGGSSRLMDLMAPSGPVYQGGTFSGNPLVMSAARATLSQLDEDCYTTLEERSSSLTAGLERALHDAAVPGVVQRVGSMLSLFFGISSACSFHDVKAADHRRYQAFFNAMLCHGVHLPPSGYESWFVSLAHDEFVLEGVVDAVAKSLHDIS